MLDKDIALEALGVICNATVTSVRKQSEDAGSSFALQASSLTFQKLSLSDSAAPTLLSINQLISTVLDGEQTCPVARYTLAAIRSDLSGGGPFSAAPAGPYAQVKPPAHEKNDGRHFIVDEDDFFDPRFNYDFTGLTDKKTYYRGGEKYKRPYGWQRFALKVLDKYDRNEWLGTTDRSTQSVEGEWPVSYHGTSYLGAEGIIKGYYKPGSRALYGPGVYSTPDIKEAEDNYSIEFTAAKNGKRYKVILQNRINPKYRKICEREDYWLVEIDPKIPEEEKKRLAEQAIRPYGLLLKEV